MSSPEELSPLELHRVLPASRERVFRAWTDAATFARWFAPSPDYEVAVHEFDVRVGGRYRVELRHKGGAVHSVAGLYQEVEGPSRLAFTWRWEENSAMPDTLVTLTFDDHDEGTELVLRHEGFVADALRTEHQKGWSALLDRLPDLL